MANRSLAPIPCLDGIRGIAALMVMVFHFVHGHAETMPSAIHKLALLGETGVDLFFVLSGFLITRILVNSRASPVYFSSFYIRRILRIFPLYFAYLVIEFFLAPWWLGGTTPAFAQQFWYWVFLQNFPLTFPSLPGSHAPLHYWSLAVEEHFYLVWPFLVYFLSLRRLGQVTLLLVLLPLGIRPLFLHFGWGVMHFTATRMDGLALGALLALALRSGSLSARQITFLRVLTVVVPMFLIPGLVLFAGKGQTTFLSLRLSAFPLLYVSLMGLLLADPLFSRMAKWLSAGWLRSIGKISYGLYVLHPLCFHLTERQFSSGQVWIDLPIQFGIAFLAASICFRFFESPILRLKDRFPY